jgi:hypothetical protein
MKKIMKTIKNTFNEDVGDILLARPIEAIAKRDLKRAKSFISCLLDEAVGKGYYPKITFTSENGALTYVRTMKPGIDMNWLVQSGLASPMGIGAYARDGMLGTVYNANLYETLVREMKDLGYKNPEKMLEPCTKYKVRRQFKIKQ